jgi:ankyrin repeat protein
MRACRNSHTACVRLLLSPNVARHPQLDLQDAEGYTAIHRAVQYSADDDILNLVGLECRAKMTPCYG